MKTISVIIPVYNASKYLKRCLNSLVKQENPFKEIICVDDASTDNSVQIIEEYQEKYNNIVILNSEINKGPAAARNMGLSIATGDYIFFVDADDKIMINFHSIYDILEKEYDIVRFRIKCGAQLSTIDNFMYDFDEERIMLPKEYFDTYPRFRSDVVYSSLIKRNLLSHNKILFDNELMFFEDNLFSLEIYINAKTIFLYHKQMYFHIYNGDSMTKKYSLKNKMISDLLKMSTKAVKLCLRYNLDKGFIHKFIINEYNDFMYLANSKQKKEYNKLWQDLIQEVST